MQRQAVLVALLTMASISAAEAGVFKLFVEAHGGGVVGKGTGGDLVNATTASEPAFFEGVPHGAYGAQIGAQFLFFTGEIQHHQFTNGSRLATWTQFGAGMRFELPVGTQTKEDKKAGKGGYFELGLGVHFGIGTGQQVMPPLSNDELTDKAFLGQARLGFGKHLNKVFDIGVVVPVSYGYFFKTGAGATVNNLSTHYQSVQAEALLVLRGNIRLF